MARLQAVMLDADDTLWHNERFFREVQDRFATLLADHAEREQIEAALHATDMRNLGRYGFGIKGFILSMVETATELAGAVSGPVVAETLAMGREMLDHPVELFDGVAEALDHLAESHRLIMVTKGDLKDQERKLAASGLAGHFGACEVVSDKTAEVYSGIAARHGFDPARLVMCGNSMRSDVLPPLEIGAWGVFLPSELSWHYEEAEAPAAHPRFRQLADIGELPALIATIEAA